MHTTNKDITKYFLFSIEDDCSQQLSLVLTQGHTKVKGQTTRVPHHHTFFRLVFGITASLPLCSSDDFEPAHFSIGQRRKFLFHGHSVHYESKLGLVGGMALGLVGNCELIHLN